MNFQPEIHYHVAVIGAGASGTLAAAQFNRLAPPQARLVLIGSQPRPARGVAYDTHYQSHLLNVPAGNMSAFLDDMDHFTRWLAKHLPGSSAGTFAPRKLYGNYLLNIFTKIRKYSNKVDYLDIKVIELRRQDHHWNIHLENGNVIEAQSIVLALGNLLLPSDPIDFRPVKSYYYRNPWSSEVTKDLHPDDPLLLIGTGLTMVDVVLSLRETGHRGPIHAISRHGRLPQAHRRYPPHPLLKLPEEFQTPRGALGWIREKVEIAKYTGSDWRAVIDSLRPHIAAIWQSWSQRQRESFLRHARNLWDIHRHRMAPEVADQLSILLEDRTLMIHCGSLVSASAKNNEVTVTWQGRETSELRTLNVARVVNCSGPSRDMTTVQSPLVSKLLASGWVSPGPLKLGLATDDDGRLLDKHGNVSPGLLLSVHCALPDYGNRLPYPKSVRKPSRWQSCLSKNRKVSMTDCMNTRNRMSTASLIKS